mmetsp:Transcript_14130/g.21460  ORF Transcript_14130/g.21460 Transcript_14130/m.21460 type:complete len:288 (-) Transcript_14130:286-1149(-)
MRGSKAALAVSAIVFALCALLNSSMMRRTLQSAVSAKRVFMIRHGQAEHNVMMEQGKKALGRLMRDPGLTEKGINQAKNIRNEEILKEILNSPPDSMRKSLVVVSPLRRTMQTAIHAFGDWCHSETQKGNKIPFVCNSDIQETGEIDCDLGRHLDEVMEEFKEHKYIDYSEIEPEWFVKEGDYRDKGPLLQKRFQKFAEWVKQRPEDDILVVAHHNIFLANLYTSFKNCEVREFALNEQDEWIAVNPLISKDDSELSDDDRTHISVYGNHAIEKLAGWGLPQPDRLR